jgi:outer membrane biosynthesis protein TonB
MDLERSGPESERSAPFSGALAWLRANGVGAAAALAALGLSVLGVRRLSASSGAPAQRKEPQLTMVRVVPEKPPAPRAPPPAPKPLPEPVKQLEQPHTARVELKAEEIAPPASPAPAASGGGKLSLAAAAEGPGDAFNLAGNPGGRGLLSGGGLGDGDGSGEGLGNGGPAARFGWYYGKVAAEVEEVLRGLKPLQSISARLELRLWIDPTGRITRVEPLRAEVDPAVREALGALIGLRISERPPGDIPMPMVARLTARRPR